MEPKLCKPKSRNAAKILQEYLHEAERIIAEFDGITERFWHEIIKERETNPSQGHNASAKRWAKNSTVKRLFELGEPEAPSHTFHDLRRETLTAMDAGEDVALKVLFESLARHAGMAPLYQSIWAAHGALENVYRPPTDSMDNLEIEPFFYTCLELDTLVLKVYLDAAKWYGEEKLIAMMRTV